MNQLLKLSQKLAGAEFDIFYNDHLQLITIKNYRPESIPKIVKGHDIMLEQKTRKNYQVLVNQIDG